MSAKICIATRALPHRTARRPNAAREAAFFLILLVLMSPAVGRAQWAILTKDGMVFWGGGGMVVDSFNSQDPNYSTNRQYTPTKHKDGGNIGNLGLAPVLSPIPAIMLSGGANVYGHISAGPHSMVTLKGGTSVGSLAWVTGGNYGIEPGWLAFRLNVVIPDVRLPNYPWVSSPSLPGSSGTVNGTNYTYVVPSGYWQTTSASSLNGTNTMCINGEVVVYFSSAFTIADSAYIYITPGSTLTIYLGDIATLAGAGLSNGAGFATNCALFGLPACTNLSFTNSSAFAGTIYAPEANLTLSGSPMNFVGSLVASYVSTSGNIGVHYDESLPLIPIPPSLSLAFSAGSPVLSLNGMLGSNFVVQYSTNLTGANWINLLSVTNLPSSPYSFPDPGGNVGARFYRAVMR